MSAGVATIRVADLSLALMACKMRRANRGRTAQFCALSAYPGIDVDCRHGVDERGRRTAAALALGESRARFMPLARGHIATLIERTHLHHGRKEMLRTWGVGVRALLAEPQHILNGGTR
ncbi:hypothetical protein [Xylophilus sp. Leaf220]|uniref:hypothetical protein n=1 Tax=Xylophilus sp. Leaf220 TaxID=1735686 RepID=UPI0006F57566|nr:hypothetical protein [Xylophilus sp. Leaf220]KQM72955.1 hypothetical protein ASE76_19445 [Xylophilus sp. Leaf220]